MPAVTAALRYAGVAVDPVTGRTLELTARQNIVERRDVIATSGQGIFIRLPGQERLAGSDEWQEFAGTSVAWPILGGAGNIDDNDLELPTGTYRAISLRSFNPETGQWSIWWLDGRNPGQLDPPVVGGFRDGIGTFQCDDTFNGKPIIVRFIWSNITETSTRWDQSFSPDGGQTWEVNWIMESTRVE